MPAHKSKLIVVLDINGTLLLRTRKAEYTKNDPTDVKMGDFYYQIRPNLHLLSEFLDKKNISYVYWSTMFCKNMTNPMSLMEKYGFNKVLKAYGQEDCSFLEKPITSKTNNCLKDLQKVANTFDVDLNDVVLMDDSTEKRVGNQNFIHVKSFVGDESDNGIVEMIQDLKTFMKQKKKLASLNS